MYKLGILSRDASAYSQVLSQAQLHDLTIIYQAETAQTTTALNDIDILLAEPDLAAKVLPHCQHLKWLQSTWAGVKPLMQIQHNDYVITGVKDIFGRQMREYVFAYMLHFSRNIEGFQQNKQQRLWSACGTSPLYGKRLGIMGVGSIGKDVAKVAKAFDMQVAGLTANSRNCVDVDEYFDVRDKVKFAQNLDYLVCLLPHTAETEHLIDAEMLNALPRHSVLINAGRGQVIDDEALIDAVEKRKIKAAVLDVFRQEPLAPSHPFWQSDYIHITQHSAAISQVKDIADIFITNYERFYQHKTLNFRIDVSRGY